MDNEGFGERRVAKLASSGGNLTGLLPANVDFGRSCREAGKGCLLRVVFLEGESCQR